MLRTSPSRSPLSRSSSSLCCSPARSGIRAARSGAWLIGVVGGTITFAVIAAAVALTARADIAEVPLTAAYVLPPAVYLIGALCGAVSYAWREGDAGLIDRLHDRVDAWGPWGVVPGEAVRGTAVAVVALTGIAGLGVAVMVALRGGEAVALFEAARVDATGATVLTLGQLVYLPTLFVWSIAWIAGPGFAVGAGTAVSPAGTQLGVVPGIPALGLLPENSSMWMLVVVLLPVAAGAFAGWIARSQLVWRNAARPVAPRAVIALTIALATAGVVAIAAVLASGSIGPGRMAVDRPARGMDGARDRRRDLRRRRDHAARSAAPRRTRRGAHGPLGRRDGHVADRPGSQRHATPRRARLLRGRQYSRAPVD